MDQQKIFKVTLGSILFLVTTIIGIWCMPELELSTGSVHPDYPTMSHSGKGVAETAVTKWITYAYGVAIVCTMCCMIFIATRKKEKAHQSHLWRKAFIGVLLYLGVYTWMVINSWNYYETGEAMYVLGFPLPTTIMLFVMWPIPLFFTFFYVFRFDQWVLSPEQESEFHQIVRRRHANQ